MVTDYRDGLTAVVFASHRLAFCLLALASAGLYASERYAPFVVVSGSMASTLLGPHRKFTCGDCGHRFACGADLPVMREKRSICPNCGAAGMPLERAPLFAGRRLLVDTHAFRHRPPRRWELAVFSPPGEGQPSCVKRIVGLPRERIDIRAGDIYADGVIQRKTLATQREMAVLVYDDRCRPAGLPSRWRPDQPNSGWRASGGVYRFIPTPGGPRRDWLTYHHARRRPGEPVVVDETPITDSQGYNQSGPILTSHVVHDVMLTARLSATPSSKIGWLITDGRSRFTVSHHAGSRQVVVWQDGRQLASGTAPDLAAGGEAASLMDAVVELSLCDRQLTYALNGVVAIEAPYVTSEKPAQPTTSPLAVSVEGGAATLSDLCVWRDVYYDDGHRRHAGSAAPAHRLCADEFYALGDNVAISRDSRSWPRVTVRRDGLIGTPLEVP